ncbi:MAG: AMP-binding protein, partial [Terriglobales bacterium]
LPPPPPDTLLEIVYTSGTTAEPKGVMITHGNVLANLRPIAGEVAKYKARLRILLPLRFLHLIPLSHLFGQIMGLLIPPLVDSTVVFPESRAPAEWARIIRQHRASALVAVPQQLQLFSQWAAAELGLEMAVPAAASRGHGLLWRFWRWRRLHRRLGWKMWAFIVGGAALSADIEAFWHALGYALVQGYGLTETAPAIAITHPFKIRRGSVGQTLAGMEVKIAPDGEILVRGGNVSPGYFRNPEATQQTFADGWLHTGDLGRMEDDKMLVFLGRKKEVIVTADGLNVYPSDVEQALDRQPEVDESAVVEDLRGGAGRVHAVAVLRPPAAPEALDRAVSAANSQLEPHQRIRSASIWPQPHLPRTTSTQKLQRTAIARWVNQGEAAASAASDGDLRDWKQFAQERWGFAPTRMAPGARLDTDLGLSSLDRVELWSWIESHAPAGAEESLVATAQTVADVDRLFTPLADSAAASPSPDPRPSSPVPIPADERGWPLRPSLRHFRSAAYSGLVFPVLRTVVTRIRVTGIEHLQSAQRPVLFIANHQSLLDVPLILRALPRPWRPWLAPAMGIEPFLGGFNPAAPAWRRARDRWRLRLSRLFFNGYLLT